jgi:hypothetical protein
MPTKSNRKRVRSRRVNEHEEAAAAAAVATEETRKITDEASSSVNLGVDVRTSNFHLLLKKKKTELVVEWQATTFDRSSNSNVFLALVSKLMTLDARQKCSSGQREFDSA